MPTTAGGQLDPFGQALWDYNHGHPARITIRRDDGLASEQDVALYFAGPEAFDLTEAEALALAKGRVLDIGCGAGRQAVVLQERGFSVVGLDVSPLALPGHRFIPVDRVLSGLAARLAAECRLRGCDAIYAALARREGVPLVTWDEQQRNRAAPVVEALTPSEALAALER
jgi:SAM-dependent methyltransferase